MSTNPQSFHCPECGASLELPGGDAVTLTCRYCHSTVIIPTELRGGVSATQGTEKDFPSWEQPHSRELAEIERLAQEGQLIPAIKLYRQTFNTGLAEAKDAVEALKAGHAVQLPRQPDAVSLGAQPDAMELDAIAQLARDGKMLDAIKRYRIKYGVDLRTAKSAVESLRDNRSVPPTPAPLPPSQKGPYDSQDGFTRGRVLLLLAIIAFALVFAMLFQLLYTSLSP